jgi:hypothetical protein
VKRGEKMQTVHRLGYLDSTTGDHWVRAAVVTSYGDGVVNRQPNAGVHRCGGWVTPLVDQWGLSEACSRGRTRRRPDRTWARAGARMSERCRALAGTIVLRGARQRSLRYLQHSPRYLRQKKSRVQGSMRCWRWMSHSNSPRWQGLELLTIPAASISHGKER